MSPGHFSEGIILSPISLNVPTATGALTLSVSPEKPLLVVGRNGAGKSALIHRFASQVGSAIYLPGARPSYFGNESSSLTPASRKQLERSLQAWDRQPDSRWQQPSGTSRNEKAIHDLTNAELQFKFDAANEIKRDGRESSAIARLQSGFSPLDRVNAILGQANLPITVAIESAEVKAVRDNKIFSIAKASDGERTALVLISEVVVAPVGSTFLIDEPELHLHPMYCRSPNNLDYPGESRQFVHCRHPRAGIGFCLPQCFDSGHSQLLLAISE